MQNSEFVDAGIGLRGREENRLQAERLNGSCFCGSLDVAALNIALSGELGDDELAAMVKERCPFLFAARPVFISRSQAGLIGDVVAALESVIALPAYRELVLANAPAIAQRGDHGAHGVFFGYDFHPFGERLGLIEINTNAGGAMLNAAMARAHRTCCLDNARIEAAIISGAVFEEAIIQMFRSEWATVRGAAPLRTIAIVDTEPQQQYLYPEFLLFQRLFASRGIDAVITDPARLTFHDGALWLEGRKIDLVYNRLTDFMLETPGTRALHEAYCADAVVLTPHPRAHALYANKHNLTIFSNAETLKTLGVAQSVIDILIANVPFTETVTLDNAERLWSERRGLFFKPVAGYGGKAAYRGDKLTKRVWQEILDGDYIAQHVVAPGVRVAGTADSPETLKFDLRSYVYKAQVQWTAARLYQGQTTNFRTPGGGFAPVYAMPDERLSAELEMIGGPAGTAACCATLCR
ncbi:MAG: hypothetical protein M3R60_06295 [Pseudomonadota bacterium]|nr:hypothetical protein [Pseudomonadota bacterium]